MSRSRALYTYVPVRIVFPLPQPSFLLISGCPFLTAVKNSRADQVGSADRGMGADQEGRPFSAGTLGFLLDREESLSISWYSDCSHKEEGFAKKDRRKKMPRQQTRARMRVEPIARKVGFLENYVGKKVRSFVDPLGALSHCLQLWPANVCLPPVLLTIPKECSGEALLPSLVYGKGGGYKIFAVDPDSVFLQPFPPPL